MSCKSPSRRTIIGGDGEIAAATRRASLEASPRRGSVFDPSSGSHVLQTPLSDVPVRPTHERRRSSSSFDGVANAAFAMLPPLAGQPPAEAQEALVRKIRQCRVLFNFGTAEAAAAKEAKRETLLEVVHYVIACPACLTAPVYREIAAMVEANVYRPLPPKAPVEGPEDEADEAEPQLEPAWPHLHAVYELLLRVLESPNFNRKLAKVGGGWGEVADRAC